MQDTNSKILLEKLHQKWRKTPLNKQWANKVIKIENS